MTRSPFLLVALVAVVVLVAGMSGSRRLRGAARAIAFIGFALFGAIALASTYGMFALQDRGGGVLILAALPCAFLSWLFWGAFTSSREQEEFLALPEREQRDRTNLLLERQIADHERTIAEHTARLQGFWITPRTRKRLRAEIGHSRAMIRGLTRMRPGDEDARAPG